MDRTPWVVILLIATGASGCIGSFADEDAPRWSPGYAFAYRTEYDHSALDRESGGGEPHDDSFEDVGTVEHFMEVLDDQAEFLGERAYLVATKLTAVPDGDGPTHSLPTASLVRARDLATIQPAIVYTDRCVAASCTQEVQHDFDEGAIATPGLRFPLTDGATWSTTIPVEDGVLAMVRSEVKGEARIRLPVGSVDTIRVDHRMLVQDIGEVEALLRQALEGEGLEVHELALTYSGRVSQWYAPDHGAIVRETAHLVRGGVLDVTSDGERIRDEYHEELHRTTELTGIRLAARDVTSPEMAQRIFLGQGALYDPAGFALGRDRFAITAMADAYELNAADGAQARISVSLGDAPPRGARVVATVTAPDGTRTAIEAPDDASSGENVVMIPFDRPGFFPVDVAIVDGDEVLARAGVYIAADHRFRDTATCGPVYLFGNGIGACTSWQVEAPTSLASISVSATAANGIELAGSIVVSDADGNEVQSAGRTASWADFGPLVLDGRAWTVSWRPNTQLLADIDLDVNFDHGAWAQPPPLGDATADPATMPGRWGVHGPAAVMRHLNDGVAHGAAS